MNRQERRRAERDAKKEKGNSNPLLLQMPLKMIQPWSVPVMHTKLPDEILQKMIDISDLVIDDEKSLSHGHNLAGQIETELLVDHEILKNDGTLNEKWDAYDAQHKAGSWEHPNGIRRRC